MVRAAAIAAASHTRKKSRDKSRSVFNSESIFISPDFGNFAANSRTQAEVADEEVHVHTSRARLEIVAALIQKND
jgi:hypothetical protein